MVIFILYASAGGILQVSKNLNGSAAESVVFVADLHIV
jgi:hypothetical protein